MTPSVSQSDQAQRSRDLLRNLLQQPRLEQNDPYGLLWQASALATRDGWQFDWAAAVEYWWDLARGGLIALLGGGSQSPYAHGPTFVITARGRRMLMEEGISPYDRTRYVLSLRQRVPAPDPIVLSYAEEAIGAFLGGFYRASIVTLGCACERLIVILAEAIRDASLEPFATKLSKHLSSNKPVGISEVFDQVRGALNGAAEDRRLPPDLADAIDRSVTPVFEHARRLRNRHGHPTGDDVSVEDAEAGLLLFPGFHSVVVRLEEHLRKLARRES